MIRRAFPKGASMKILSAVLGLCLSLVSCAPPEIVSGEVNHIQEVKDSFTGESSYQTKYFECIPSKGQIYCPFSIRLFSSSKKETPNMVVNYRSSEWFFLSNISIKTSTGQIIQLAGDHESREVRSGYVEEYVFFHPTESDLAAIGFSNSIEIRFVGNRVGSSSTNMVHANIIWAVRQFFAMKEKQS